MRIEGAHIESIISDRKEPISFLPCTSDFSSGISDECSTNNRFSSKHREMLTPFPERNECSLKCTQFVGCTTADPQPLLAQKGDTLQCDAAIQQFLAKTLGILVHLECDEVAIRRNVLQFILAEYLVD
jgi:hypothetical protein